MARSTKIMSILGAGVLALSVSACGGSSEYCDVLNESNEAYSELDSLDPTNTDSLKDMAGTMQDIADAAPDDIKEDWATLADTFQQLVDADGDMEALANLDTTALTESSEAVATHAQEECDISMS